MAKVRYKKQGVLVLIGISWQAIQIPENASYIKPNKLHTLCTGIFSISIVCLLSIFTVHRYISCFMIWSDLVIHAVHSIIQLYFCCVYSPLFYIYFIWINNLVNSNNEFSDPIKIIWLKIAPACEITRITFVSIVWK